VLIAAAALALTFAAGTAAAEVAETKLTYPSRRADGPIEQIPATLRVTATAPGTRAPAVVVVHSSAGVEDTNPGYIAALNAAGIATLEVDYFTTRGVATLTRPGTTPRPMPGQSVPDSVAALAFLGRSPAIDPNRIGILGFSFGGMQALLTTSAMFRPTDQPALKFAAHVGVYPGCATFAPGGAFAALIGGPLHGSPVLILSGTADAFDEPDSCAQLLAALSPASRALFSVTLYPGATHGWDKPSAPRTMRDPSARDGIVTITADPAATAASIAATVAFLRRAFDR
jgi:dienelactone hydrolase